MPTTNRQLKVAAWPDGLPKPADFTLADSPVPAIADGQVLIRNHYLSIDPYYRHALGPRFLGTPFRKPGDVMMAVTAGQVLQSRDPVVPEGAWVTTLLGDMQDYVAVGGRDVRLLPNDVFGEGGLPLQTSLGVLGMPGLTAYSALLEHARPRPGQTFVVSSAAGCVGATAGQIAKILGLRAIGIAGLAEKCAWVTEQAGLDACVSYKSPTFAADLQAACPHGIDINMEHVGGAVLQTVLAQMALYGRVVMSGLIDQYNAAISPPGPNWGVILSRRLTVTGLRVFDHVNLLPEFERFLAPKVRDGSLAYKEDVSQGLEHAAASLARVLTGANFGKSLIKLEL